LIFFLTMAMLVIHVVSCLWIYWAMTDPNPNNWIQAYKDGALEALNA